MLSYKQSWESTLNNKKYTERGDFMKTQTDKTKEIQKLIEQIIKNEEHEKQYVFKRTQQLDSYGPDIVNLILSKLHTHRTEGKFPNADGDYLSSPIFCLVDEMTKFAEPQHAIQLARMLLWPEIVLERDDRSIRGKLVKALERIGNISIVPLLEEYAEKVKQVVYRDRKKHPNESYLTNYLTANRITVEQLHEIDQQEIADAITACKQRPTK